MAAGGAAARGGGPAVARGARAKSAAAETARKPENEGIPPEALHLLPLQTLQRGAK